MGPDPQTTAEPNVVTCVVEWWGERAKRGETYTFYAEMEKTANTLVENQGIKNVIKIKQLQKNKSVLKYKSSWTLLWHLNHQKWQSIRSTGGTAWDVPSALVWGGGAFRPLFRLKKPPGNAQSRRVTTTRSLKRLWGVGPEGRKHRARRWLFYLQGSTRTPILRLQNIENI